MKQLTRTLLGMLAGACFSGMALAEQSASAQEAVSKVREAAAYLAEKGESGLQAFSTWDSPFVWKDSYVFVFRCGEGLTAAYPMEGFTNRPIAAIKDKKDKAIGSALCNAATEEKGDWVEYYWPKPHETTPSRKISYMMKVAGTPYEVGAGVYDADTNLQDLRALLQ